MDSPSEDGCLLIRSQIERAAGWPVVPKVPSQYNSQLPAGGGDAAWSTPTGRVHPRRGLLASHLTPTTWRQVRSAATAERCQSGLPDDCVDAEPYPIDHTCAPRPDSQATPAPRGAH